MFVYPNQTIEQLNSFENPVFQHIEKQFDEWLKHSNPAMEYEEKYYGDEAIYTKRGAIAQAIENLIEEANESNKPVNVKTFDIECAFED